MKNRKLKLNKLKVQSFVTVVSSIKEQTVKGGFNIYTQAGPAVCHIGTREDSYDVTCPVKSINMVCPNTIVC